MNKKIITSRILICETLGFLFIVILFWCNELLDLPHRLFGAPATPVNIVEGIIESLVIVTCGILVIIRTRYLIRRIKQLEGFLNVCAICRKINVADDWIELDTYIHQNSEAEISHSFCPACYEQQLAKYTRHAGKKPDSDRATQSNAV